MRHALHAEICQLSSRGQTRRGPRLYEGLQFPASNNPALDSPKTMRPVLITTIQKLFLLCCVLTVSSLLAESLPPIAINDNHKPSGILRDGVLTIQLEIAKGEWHPEADDGIALAVYAFGEAGRPLQNPGPLIRVPQGTELHVSLHNALAVTISVHGLGDPTRSGDATVHVAPGAVE